MQFAIVRWQAPFSTLFPPQKNSIVEPVGVHFGRNVTQRNWDFDDVWQDFAEISNFAKIDDHLLAGWRWDRQTRRAPWKKVICWRNWRQMSFKSQNAVVTSDKYIDETFDEYSDVTSKKNTLMRLLINTVMWLLINTSLQSDWWGDLVRQGPNFLSLFPFGATIICFHFLSASKTTLK